MALVPLDIDTLRVEAISRISFVIAGKDKDGNITHTPVWPSRDLLQSVLSCGKWDGIPVCDLVTEVPLVAADGTIHSEEGYSPATRAYLTTSEFAFRRNPADVTQAEAIRALGWIRSLPFSGFPFEDEASETHALTALLQHTVIRVIRSNTPLFLHDASTPGSGEGLLAEIISMVHAPDQF